MRKHLKYLSYVVRHKWFVLLAGLRVGAPLWRLLIHDWSKFTPAEWGPYVAKFYGGEPTAAELRFRYHGRPNDAQNLADWKCERDTAFNRAWLHHQHANPHHWQHWLLREDNPRPRYLLQSHDCISDLFIHEVASGLEVDVSSVALVNDPQSERYPLLTALLRQANSSPIALPMPEHFIREMVADWMGAGRAITGRWEAVEWYAKNADKMVLHPDTRARVESLLGITDERERAAA